MKPVAKVVNNSDHEWMNLIVVAEGVTLDIGTELYLKPTSPVHQDEREIIPDHEIERVHANANFGQMDKRDVVRLGVLKCASGYHQGSTSNQICREHGLITSKYELTPKGRAYLWAAFSHDMNF